MITQNRHTGVLIQFWAIESSAFLLWTWDWVKWFESVDCLKKLQGHIIGVHLKDIVQFDNPKANDTVVSKGVINFPAVHGIKAQDFKGMLSLNMSPTGIMICRM
jgi:hypothetical protein